MIKSLFLVIALFSSVRARAGCEELLGKAAAVRLFQPSLRLLLNNGIEIELQLDSYRGNKLFQSRVLFGPHGLSVESRRSAEVRYYNRHIFDLERIEISEDRKQVTLSDGRRTFHFTLYFEEPFRPTRIIPRSLGVYAKQHRWVSKFVPAISREGDFVILPPLEENNLDFEYHGGASDQIADALKNTLNDEDFVKSMLDEVKPLLEFAQRVPYARDMNFTLKYYRGLVLATLNIKGRASETYAFSMVKSAVQMFDLLSGLRALGLSTKHPIFKFTERLSQRQIH